MNIKRAVTLSLGFVIAGNIPPILATNGMNLEGYGPVATGMGGTGMGYDHGSAAVMHNPATLGLMPEGHRLDLAIGGLGPNGDSSSDIGSVDSTATAFYMPALGWISKQGALAYGFGVFAQGGMGTDYAPGSAVDQSGPAGVNLVGVQNTDAAAQRSELGVGRFIFPLAFNVNPRLTLGGSIDYVWGGLDLLWTQDARNFLGALDGANLNDGGTGKAAALGAMVAPANVRSIASGSLVDAFVQGFDTTGGVGAPNGAFSNFYWARFAFSNASDFTQETLGTGVAGKLGFAYRFTDRLTLGGTYHNKTRLSDLEGDAVASFKVDTTTAAPVSAQTGLEVPVQGTVKIVDFQWPQTLGLGIAYQATERWLLAADWMRHNWSAVMPDLKLKFTAGANQTGMAQGFAGTTIDYVYFQKWEDQDSLRFGGAYRYSDALTLRAGYNYAKNPIPDDYVNFLFPATVAQHYTAGLGYAFTKQSSIDVSLTYVPEVRVTESQTEANNIGTPAAQSFSHKQLNWQFLYSYRY